MIGYDPFRGVWDKVEDTRYVTHGSDAAKYWRWLQRELPPDVSKRIISIKHYGKPRGRAGHYKLLEVSFCSYGDTPGTTVVINKRGFKCAATIALLCLVAP